MPTFASIMLMMISAQEQVNINLDKFHSEHSCKFVQFVAKPVHVIFEVFLGHAPKTKDCVQKSQNHFPLCE
jgi:hypothetical protein